MPQKSLISRLRGLALIPGLRSGRVSDASDATSTAPGDGLRILRPPEVGGRESNGGGEHSRVERLIDVVVRSALRSGVLEVEELESVSIGEGFSVDWRAICAALPERADTLRRFAAGVYGFQPVVVSQIGTLVLADSLSRSLSEDVWRQCFRLDCIPVLPHGITVESAHTLTLASPDPARAAVRNLSRSLMPGNSTLAYADLSVIREMMAFLAAEVPQIADAVRPVVDTPVALRVSAA